MRRSLSLNARSEHLDALRAAAALLVWCGHVRPLLFVNHSALSEPGPLAYAFYAVTDLGHQAVIVFFALSGYLVGGPALIAMRAGRFDWLSYALRRLTRLWIVLIPALCLTFLLDQAGAWLAGGLGYDGAYFGAVRSGPAPGQALDHSWAALLGNLAFLQTIAVPIYGSNDPAWSLANEFWYYALFPALASLVAGRGPRGARAAAAVFSLAALVLLPPALTLLGAIWAAGAVAAQQAGEGRWRGGWTAAAGLLALVAVAASERHPGLLTDLLLGLCVSALLPGLAHLPSLGTTYRRLARWGSEVSFSLYLLHYPFLLFLVFGVLTPQPSEPGPAAFLGFVALGALTSCWVALWWWVFERNTGRVFRTVHALAGAALERLGLGEGRAGADRREWIVPRRGG